MTTGEAEYEYPGTATGTKKGYELSTNSEDYPDEKREHHYDELNLDGTMTLNQVSEQFNISTDQLAGVIGVPVSRSGERLGRLRKIYGFDLNELREYIIKQGKDK